MRSFLKRHKVRIHEAKATMVNPWIHSSEKSRKSSMLGRWLPYCKRKSPAFYIVLKHKKALTFQPELLFICNFLSSSIGFIPYSCFHRFTFVFIFRFNILGFPLHRFLCFASSFFPPDSSLPFVCVNPGF